MKRWNKGIYYLLITSLLGLVSIIIHIYGENSSIVFESEESRTLTGGAIYNEIKWFKQGSKDIWMMNQAQHGLGNEQDRLAIIVENSFTPARVKFFQLAPGELKWTGNEKVIGYKVPCYICHSNGPRAIRPVLNSLKTPVGWKNQVKIFLWNLKIKSYKNLKEHDDQKRSSFKRHGGFANERLKVATCTNCHKEKGLLARGFLTRQHKITIEHMLNKGHMPPIGFNLSDTEKAQIQRFLKGFEL